VLIVTETDTSSCGERLNCAQRILTVAKMMQDMQIHTYTHECYSQWPNALEKKPVKSLCEI